MSGILRMELDRAFRNRRFLLVCLLAMACFVYGFYDAGRSLPGLQTGAGDWLSQNAFELWLYVHFRSFYLYLAPVAAALPFVDSLWVDRSQGFLRFILARTTYRRYLAAKTLVNLAAGAAAVGGPLLLLFAYTSMTASCVLPTRSLMFTTWGGQDGSPLGVLAGLYARQPAAYILFLVALAALFGAVYATLGLAVSSLIHNRYAALSAPFIVFVVSAFTADRARHLGSHWSPAAILIPYNTAQATALTLLAQLGLTLAASALLLWVFGRRERIVS